ncbi:MAG TPA: type 2 lanthipeptide synthetase LanM family protein [Rhizomicrobium sp.]|jgi:type 2 lantibiotic biosynthesis protein LanM
MTSNAGTPHFDVPLGCLLAPSLAELATQLGGLAGLAPSEQSVILAAAREALIATLHGKLARLLLLELNAARIEGRLKGDSGEARWNDFLALSSSMQFWEGLSPNYPTLAARIDTMIANRVSATMAFARRWVADRKKIAALLGNAPGHLTKIAFGAGDAHQGGHTVVIMSCDGGKLAYKPRPVAVEAALARFLAKLSQDRPLSVRVPAVADCGDHGWAEFVTHRHAAGPDEMRSFYRGIGQWLAIMRLVSGSDLHAENLIAHGGTPVLIDCETLFTPKIQAFVSGFGDATDQAIRLITGTVFATGLLPGRGQGLGWRGIDVSGIGSLPGQQPMMTLPDIIDAGTDAARIGLKRVALGASQNHPAETPSLAEYWPEVLDGFEMLSAELRELDSRGKLRSWLDVFEECRIRVVVRATEVYAELARMLWHPVSLHKEDEARERARDLLARQAANIAGAPSDAAVIEGEIDALLTGDIPYFSTIAREGALDGPAGTRWLSPCNRVDEAWQDWRGADLVLERNFVCATLVSAYTNDSTPTSFSLRPAAIREGKVDTRRRTLAASMMRSMVDTAIYGRDGTATWLAPTLTATGWGVQALGADLYGGISGAAVLMAAYLHEVQAGRADPVDGIDRLFSGLTRTLDGLEEKHESNLRRGMPLRPPSPSVYLGVGAQVWARLLFAEWGFDRDGVARAALLARQIPAAAKADKVLDILAGSAGGIAPLLALAKASGNDEFLQMARAIGDDLCARAQWRDGTACWVTENSPEGMGGFAHGATGFGWSLIKLARATGDERYSRTGEPALAFDDALYDADDQCWIDLRRMEGQKAAYAWCHGSVGIGLARLDLDPSLSNPATRSVLRRAATATWRDGVGWSHCVCHGDMSVWEMIDRAIALGEGPDGLSREQLAAYFLTGIEDHGPITGLLKDAFVPGLFPGVGGIAYQLLRMNPASDLPSLLTPA